MLRWFRHVERMNGERMAKRVYNSGAQRERGRERRTRVWMNGVKEAVPNIGLSLEPVGVTVQDRAEWIGLVNML